MEDEKAFISEDLKELVELSQKIIVEFFQEKCGNSFDEEKRNRLQKVFDTFSVISEDARTIHFYGGRCSCEEKKIEINREIKVYPMESQNGINQKYKLMIEIIHEYAHAFSNKGKVDHKDMWSTRCFEEGMACLFEESVLDHYFKKNGIKAKSRSIGYDSQENAMPRTILFKLKEDDLYVRAMMEYFLGDKKRFLEMLLPQEIVEKQNVYENMVSVNFSPREVFDSSPDSYKEIDESSVFCHKNSLIFAFWLQTMVPEDILSKEEFLKCNSKDEALQKYQEWKKENEERNSAEPTEEADQTKGDEPTQQEDNSKKIEEAPTILGKVKKMLSRFRKEGYKGDSQESQPE